MNGPASALCRDLYARLRERWSEPGELVLGPDIASGEGPEVRRMHERGAHFFWVAAALDGASFWHLHVGAVVDPATLRVRCGIHHAADWDGGAELFTLLAPLAAQRGLARFESPLADEVQLVGSERELNSDAAIAAVCDEMESLVRATQPFLWRMTR